MNKILLLSGFLVCSYFSFAQKSAGYKVNINLAEVNDDKVQVEMIPPRVNQNEIIYYIPKIVPGTYSEDDFGRYIEDFLALDKKGNPLVVSKINENGWKISNAKSLQKILYKVNDTFDDSNPGSKKIFEPAGSNIQADTNFVINTHCFVGYFDGMKQIPYALTIKHSPGFYGVTSMEDADKDNTSDVFTTDSYNQLVDHPIMYCTPDTASISIGESRVLVGVYSPNKKIRASFLAENFNKLLQAQAKYLGGNLPVKKYAFVIYLTDHSGVSGGIGALEHSYSSMYFLPEGEPNRILQFFLDVAAHEFFHIVTPLSIHSEEIHYFDFNAPKMSKHLWLYEGTTEYHAHMVQEKFGLTTKEAFLNVISQKITSSRQLYNDTLPFTTMSANCLYQYSKEYGNVYQKGALIAMCLDVKLRQLSKEKYGIMNLIFDLSKKYGKDKPFKDDELFDVIAELTYPEIKKFFTDYVSGNKPLPLEEVLAAVGVDFKPVVETKDSVFTLGSISVGPGKGTSHAVITNVSKINEFGKKMGYKVNDEIISLNGSETTATTINKQINDLYKTSQPGDMLTIVVNRKNEGGVDEKITLSAPMIKIPVLKYNQLGFASNPSAEQLSLRNSWLGTN